MHERRRYWDAQLRVTGSNTYSTLWFPSIATIACLHPILRCSPTYSRRPTGQIIEGKDFPIVRTMLSWIYLYSNFRVSWLPLVVIKFSENTPSCPFLDSVEVAARLNNIQSYRLSLKAVVVLPNYCANIGWAHNALSNRINAMIQVFQHAAVAVA